MKRILAKARALARAGLSILVDLCAVAHGGHLTWMAVEQVLGNEIDPTLFGLDVVGLVFCAHHMWHRCH